MERNPYLKYERNKLESMAGNARKLYLNKLEAELTDILSLFDNRTDYWYETKNIITALRNVGYDL